MYPVCRSVIGLSCVDVIRSFTYVLRVVILTSLNDVGRERARDRKREANGLSQIPSKKERKKEKKERTTKSTKVYKIKRTMKFY